MAVEHLIDQPVGYSSWHGTGTTPRRIMPSEASPVVGQAGDWQTERCHQFQVRTMANVPSVVEKLRNLEACAVSNIERLQDFHVLTGYSYDRYSKMVEAGHLSGSVKNIRTGTNLDVAQVAKQLLKYLDDDLLRVVIYQVISDFEAFFFDFLELIVRNNPHALSQQRHVTVSDVLNNSDMDHLLKYIIQKELHELQYKNVYDWFTYLQKLIHLKSIGSEDVGRIAELKATRDAFAHNEGIANDIYISKAGDRARAEAGQRLTLSRPYLYDSADFLKRLVSDLTEAACSRLEP